MRKILILLAALLLLAGCKPVRYDAENISRLYDRDWIIGRSRAEIEEKYREFDREFTSDEGEILGAFYVNYENRGLDLSYIHDTYLVVIDDDDIADVAYFLETSIGG